MNAWQLIFSQSKVNGRLCKNDLLPDYPWEWPQKTWFQQRLLYTRQRRRQVRDKVL
jgi:hypothetical protein